MSRIDCRAVLLPALLSVLLLGCGSPETGPTSVPPPSAFSAARSNGSAAQEAFSRAHRYMDAWLAEADPETGLIPRNLNDDRHLWNAADAAADNYPFLVLTAALTDRDLFEDRIRRMLRVERRRTSRLGPLPDTYSFRSDTFTTEEPDLPDLIFGASEYVKDGLLPLTEWLGPSPWSERMVELVDGIWARAPIETAFGRIPAESHEVNGEMLQVLSRLYWMTGRTEMLDRAIRLGDYYLLGDHHPTRDADRLRLRDHGCEILSGLVELYAAVSVARPGKKDQYTEPLHAMLDRVLEVGRNPDGLFYNEIDPQSGAVLDENLADTFGYTLNAYYTVYQIDSTEAYRAAVRTALSALDRSYREYVWESGSADGDADAVESALNLYPRMPLPETARWIEHSTRRMWAKQDSSGRAPQWQGSGVIEGWHGDGNFARTTLMYALWKTAGTTLRPWRPDLAWGAERRGDTLLVHAEVQGDSAYRGTLRFDAPRHRTSMGLPADWPRINQFPEWYPLQPSETYRLASATGSEAAETSASGRSESPSRQSREAASSARSGTFKGQALIDGRSVRIPAGGSVRMVVTPE